MKPEIYKEKGHKLPRPTRQPVGHLINPGRKDTLEWKRIILSGFIPAAA